MAENLEEKKVEPNKPKQEKPKTERSKSDKPKFNVYWVYAIIAVVFIGMQFMNFGSGAIQTNWNDFKQRMLNNDDVKKVVVVNRERVEIFIKDDRLSNERYKDVNSKGVGGYSKTEPQFYFTIGSVEVFEQQLEDAQSTLTEKNDISVFYETRTDYFRDILSYLLPIIILIAIWMFIFKRFSGGGGGSQIFNIGKSKAQLFDKESHIKINFKDVAGLEEAKIEIKEIVDFLKNPQKYTELGGKIPKGVLLVGPPGTGKTLLAKAVAGEANVPFFSMSGSDFVEMFVGVGASRVRDLFKQAKSKSPCIIFIDEIDAIGRARGKNANYGANDERENTLNQLLTEMDGFATNSGVMIMAATNRADILDRALMRAGRFDRQISVELPDLNERKEIFEVHMRPLKVSTEVNIDFLSKQTPGFSGADIANLCNEAALIAARTEKKQIEKQDFLDAIDRIIGGLEKKNKIISIDEKRTVAFHEAGHATTSWLLEYANPLVKVTIIPRGKALGAAWYLPEERQITTMEQILDEMCATLGGRASEELIFGKISTGALNDLERVTKQAYAMVAYYGMGKSLKNISYYDSSGQNEYGFTKPYSEKTAEEIDKEVSIIIELAYHKSKELLTQHKEGLIKLAELLLEREVIFSEDLEAVFGKRAFGNATLENIMSSKKETPNNVVDLVEEENIISDESVKG